VPPKRIQCPACGSFKVSSRKVKRKYFAPLGPPIACEVFEDTCEECTESGDFRGRNDARIERAIKESTYRTMPHLMEKILSSGVTEVYFERVLGLPFGTVKRWKEKYWGTTPAEAALLRLISTHVWLLDVADRGYKP
jgi:DNA-binding transcriptional regulator YiaG